MKSFEADELAQAQRTIAELEAELAAVKAAGALFDGEPISPRDHSGLGEPEPARSCEVAACV